MRHRPNIPIALTIAGSDSGGGAGIQADLKTFAALGVHGTCAITCLTAQNPLKVLAIETCSPRIVQRQILAVFAQLCPAAAKTGMLYSPAIVQTVVDAFGDRRVPLVVDPVLVSTSGRLLLEDRAQKLLRTKLLPIATLITPNLPEAEMLTASQLNTPEDVRAAARELYSRFGCAVLLKGGHLRGLKDAIDIFYDGKQELLLSAPFIRGVKTHGTGCTYSAAITAYLARGFSLPRAIAAAKDFVTQAIARSQLAAGHPALNTLPFHNTPGKMRKL